MVWGCRCCICIGYLFITGRVILVHLTSLLFGHLANRKGARDLIQTRGLITRFTDVRHPYPFGRNVFPSRWKSTSNHTARAVMHRWMEFLKIPAWGKTLVRAKYLPYLTREGKSKYSRTKWQGRGGSNELTSCDLFQPFFRIVLTASWKLATKVFTSSLYS